MLEIVKNLFQGIKNNNLEMVKESTNKTNINILNEKGHSPLSYAVGQQMFHNNDLIIKFLLENGAITEKPFEELIIASFSDAEFDHIFTVEANIRAIKLFINKGNISEEKKGRIAGMIKQITSNEKKRIEKGQKNSSKNGILDLGERLKTIDVYFKHNL